MENSTNKEVADMLTELIFRFSGVLHRSPSQWWGRKSIPTHFMCCICWSVPKKNAFP